jgi:hypothetical protein
MAELIIIIEQKINLLLLLQCEFQEGLECGFYILECLFCLIHNTDLFRIQGNVWYHRLY